MRTALLKAYIYKKRGNTLTGGGFTSFLPHPH